MTTNGNIDGHKRCKCKKSKCLKRYCECFGAGLYCAEACSCQECFNKLDYEDKVQDARKQIELQNPFAFSHKIDYLIQPPNNHGVGGDQLVPIVGKHKTGCNCRKSMCQQRYCVCYQANVGCTDGCRCEGCINIYGKKEEYNVYNEYGSMRPRIAKLHDPDNELESVTMGLVHEFHNPQNTSLAPFQHSGHGRCIPSSGLVNNDMIVDTSRENLDTVPIFQQFYRDDEYMNQSVSMELVHEFHNPQNTSLAPFQHSGHGSITSTGRYIPSSGLVNNDMIVDTRENFDMVPPIFQQFYPEDEYMNLFPPQDATDISSRNLDSMLNLPSMVWQQSSQAVSNVPFMSSLHHQCLPVSTPASLVGGPNVDNSLEKPMETVHSNTPNLPGDFPINSSTGSITSPSFMSSAQLP